MTLDRLQAHYGFTRTPFGKGLAPGMLHRHTAHAEAVARIGWCITERALGVVTGEVGAGKTVAVRAALAALEAHVARGVRGRGLLELPARRELSGKADPEHPDKVVGLTRHHPLRTDLVEQMDQAIRADERAKRYLTRSAWIQDAVRAAIADADQRAGRRLPKLPSGTRLPNQPRKTGQ